LERSSKSCRIVKPLNRGLPPGAKPSLINRMMWISLYLNDVTISILREHSATGRTFPAGRCVPGCLAWNDILRRNDVRNKPSSRLGASGQSSRTSQPRDPKEISTAQVCHKRFRQYLSIFGGILSNGLVHAAAIFATQIFFILCPVEVR